MRSWVVDLLFGSIAALGILLAIYLVTRETPVSDADLTRWGYHREKGNIVINDDRLTLHLNGSVTDSHGDYVGRVELNP